MTIPDPPDERNQGRPTPSDVGGSATADEEQNAEPEHPIASSINTFLNRVRDIEESARKYVPSAIKSMKEEISTCKQELDEATNFLTKEDQQAQIVGIKTVMNASQRIERLAQSQAPDVLQSSLFLGMFSAYEAFTGNLLTAIYNKKPELFNSISKPIAVSEILKHDSFEALKTAVLQDEVEEFRRKGYAEQFDFLEKTFDVKLKDFGRWAEFVECAQRRHLITHNDGIVTEQYLRASANRLATFHTWQLSERYNSLPIAP